LAPANTPKAVIDKLNQAINDITNQDQLKDRFISEGASIERETPYEFQLMLRKELAMWKSLVKSASLNMN